MRISIAVDSWQTPFLSRKAAFRGAASWTVAQVIAESCPDARWSANLPALPSFGWYTSATILSVPGGSECNAEGRMGQAISVRVDTLLFEKKAATENHVCVFSWVCAWGTADMMRMATTLAVLLVSSCNALGQSLEALRFTADIGITPRVLAAAGGTRADADRILVWAGEAVSERVSLEDCVQAEIAAVRALAEAEIAARESEEGIAAIELLHAKENLADARAVTAETRAQILSDCTRLLAPVVRSNLIQMAGSPYQGLPPEYRARPMSQDEVQRLLRALQARRLAERTGAAMSSEDVQTLSQHAADPRVAQAMAWIGSRLSEIELAWAQSVLP